MRDTSLHVSNFLNSTHISSFIYMHIVFENEHYTVVLTWTAIKQNIIFQENTEDPKSAIIPMID